MSDEQPREESEPAEEKPPEKKKRRSRDRPKWDDAMIDEASEESFPASDPPSSTGTTA